MRDGLLLVEVLEKALGAYERSSKKEASGLIGVDDSHAGPDLRVWAHEGRR
jgi:hypothetical protein